MIAEYLGGAGGLLGQALDLGDGIFVGSSAGNKIEILVVAV
jgi:hypothetical protein